MDGAEVGDLRAVAGEHGVGGQRGPDGGGEAAPAAERHLDVPGGPGIGVDPLPDVLDELTVHRETITQGSG